MRIERTQLRIQILTREAQVLETQKLSLHHKFYLHKSFLNSSKESLQEREFRQASVFHQQEPGIKMKFSPKTNL